MISISFSGVHLLVDVLPAVIGNHLWQSTLFVVVVWLLTVVLRKNRAAIRHCLWFAASVKFLIPLSLLVELGIQLSPSTAPLVAPGFVRSAVERISEPFPVPAFGQVSRGPLSEASSYVVSFDWFFWIRVLLYSIWFFGFVAGMALWFIRWRRLRLLVRNSTPIELGLPIPAKVCPGRMEPGVFGIARPVLLLPAGIHDALSPEQLQAVFTHELCHVRRRDNLTAAIHMLVEAAFWFHPFVWWIKARLIDEQERACDEEVLRRGCDPQVYSETLLRICNFYIASPLLSASGMTGSDLRKRIADIMQNRSGVPLGWSRATGLILLAAAVLIGPVALGSMRRMQIPSGTTSGVQVSGFESEGITLISPAALDFDARVDTLAPAGMADVVKGAKPYVVIVSNSSSRKVVALTLSSKHSAGVATPSALIRMDPSDEFSNQLFMAPDAVRPSSVDFGDRSEPGIPPGGQRLIGVGFEIPHTRPKFTLSPDAPGWDDERMWSWVVSTTKDMVDRMKQQSPATVGTTVKLDAVIFEDGTLIGSDSEGRLQKAFESHVRVKQDLYGEVVGRLDKGLSVDEAFSFPGSEMPPDPTRMDDYAMFRPEAISTVKNLRKAYGDEKIRDVLRQAILKEPFVIQRK